MWKDIQNISNLNQHDEIHTGEKPYQCTQCDKTLKTWVIWSNRTRFTQERNHTNALYVTRQSKNEWFEATWRDSHRRWTIKMHPIWQDIQDMSDLKQHDEIHKGKKPYQCTQCEKTFKTWVIWSNMTRFTQERNHTNALNVARHSKHEWFEPTWRRKTKLNRRSGLNFLKLL